MQVNQEIDALKTLGIAPMEFLVLPRMLALALMMPCCAFTPILWAYWGYGGGGRDAQYRLYRIL